jgi:hypothetical protein
MPATIHPMTVQSVPVRALVLSMAAMAAAVTAALL